MRRILAVTVLLLAGLPAMAHRLDEYLQATLLSIENDRIDAEIRLTPGIAILPKIIDTIDTNADGIISDPEQRAYTERVLRDLSISVDGHRLQPRLVSMKFPSLADMQEGLGEIQIRIEAGVPRGGPNRKLVFENHHRRSIGVYLVNCLVPRNPAIRIEAQKRNYDQSFYELSYTQAASAGFGWIGVILLLLLARIVYFFFRAVASRRTNAACSGDSMPFSTTLRRDFFALHTASGSSQSPGNTRDRSNPSSSALISR